MATNKSPMMVCDDCNGDAFHIQLVGTHNHAQCANPICGKEVCMTGECKPAPESKPSTPNCPICKGWSFLADLDGTYICHHCKHEFEGPSSSCSYCESGILQDGECQKCGL